MNQNKHINHLIWFFIAVLCVSTSGPLGRYIDLPTPVIIWWRCCIATLCLLVFCIYKKIDLRINTKKDRGVFFIGALFMGAHWITFFYALKLSNVAIGMLSLYTFPVMVALLEPVFSKTKLDPVHIFLGILVLLGLYILAPDFNIESTQVQGILFGLLSALCYTLRILILKSYIKTYNGTMLMFYQVLIITILLAPVLYYMGTSNISTQYPYVILLGVLTTAIGHTMVVNSLKHFKASTASILSSTQPIFGIILAFFFLKEIPTIHTFVGGAFILATVVIESIRSKKG